MFLCDVCDPTLMWPEVQVLVAVQNIMFIGRHTFSKLIYAWYVKTLRWIVQSLEAVRPGTQGDSHHRPSTVDKKINKLNLTDFLEINLHRMFYFFNQKNFHRYVFIAFHIYQSRTKWWISELFTCITYFHNLWLHAPGENHPVLQVALSHWLFIW